MGNDEHASTHDGLTRRDLLRRLGLASAAAFVSPAVLAACGSSGGGGGSTGTTAGSGTTAAASGDVGKELLDALGVPATDKLGGGATWTIGSVLALTGNGSFYGKTMSRGMDLAAKHIKAAGGPDIKIVYKDHKSGDPQAGVQAMTELGTANIPAKLASYGDDILAMLPLTQQYKCLTLDGGGGNGGAGQSQDFFWGTRALTAIDPIPGMIKYLEETYPDAKTIGVTGWDLGAKNNDDYKTIFTKAISGSKFQLNGLWELAPPNSTDFANVLTKIKANEPDILVIGSYGQDIGFFLDQSQTANLKCKFMGFELTPDGIAASKGAMDSVGWTFTSDFFNADQPLSKLAKLFVREFKAAYGDAPDFYAANYYENTLDLWDIYRRVLAKGGNVNSGVELQDALKENTTLPSVYGGDDSTLGTFTLDPKTHSPIKRPMGVFHYQDKKLTTLATFDIGGLGYKKV
jgi:ABC-type branched-subunit amino acid transport system substrate-binding protein